MPNTRRRKQIKDFVQEALDAIEYAIGPVNSKWGALRAANGHPAPFPLRYIEIGNEASGKVYRTNYVQFVEAIRAKYPSLTIIGNQRIKDAPVEIVDDHKYGNPASFFNAHGQYDKADRGGPKGLCGRIRLQQRRRRRQPDGGARGGGVPARLGAQQRRGRDEFLRAALVPR